MEPDEDREAVENREISGGKVWETFERTLTRKGKPFGTLPGGHPMKDENGDMVPDEDREAVENREAAGIARFQVE